MLTTRPQYLIFSFISTNCRQDSKMLTHPEAAGNEPASPKRAPSKIQTPSRKCHLPEDNILTITTLSEHQLLSIWMNQESCVSRMHHARVFPTCQHTWPWTSKLRSLSNQSHIIKFLNGPVSCFPLGTLWRITKHYFNKSLLLGFTTTVYLKCF